MIDVRDGLKKIIAEQGLIQSVVAERAELTPMKLSSILNKKRKLDSNEMFKLCDVLKITPDELKRISRLQSD